MSKPKYRTLLETVNEGFKNSQVDEQAGLLNEEMDMDVDAEEEEEKEEEITEGKKSKVKEGDDMIDSKEEEEEEEEEEEINESLDAEVWDSADDEKRNEILNKMSDDNQKKFKDVVSKSSKDLPGEFVSALVEEGILDDEMKMKP